MAAEADHCCGRRRFAVACSVLSHCVRAAETSAASSSSPSSHSRSAASHSPMLLMPGADVAIANDDDDDEEEEEEKPGQQMTIVYGGRALVFDGVPADRAAEVVRVAAAAAGEALQVQGIMPGLMMPDLQLQVARKASLQRLLEKRRRDRLRGRASSSSNVNAPAAGGANREQRGKDDADTDRWLVLGIPG